MRLAVVGLGYMGGVHLKAIASLPAIELAAVVSRRAAETRVKHYTTLDDALADPLIDAVDLCLPTDLHESAAIAALRSGKHVLVEKPMALSVKSCHRMIAEAERAKKILMVAHVLRFFPAYIALQHAVEHRELGEIRFATFRRRCAQPGWSEWITDPSRSGGGAFDLLIHDIDMALRLFGPPSAIAATGYENAPAGVDTISARLFYEKFVVEISGGWMFPGAFPFAMEFTVLGDHGILEFNSESRPLKRYGSGEAVTLEPVDGYAAEIAYFAACCRSGEQPSLCDPASSAESIRLALGMFGARSKNGERVSWK
ncbi:MAG: Gfo/Idh/MocA family oxidoreductase [Bryobacteraceae bacterium]